MAETEKTRAKKHFISFMAQQVGEDLKEVSYDPVDNCSLRYEDEKGELIKSRFPLIILLATQIENGDDVRITIFKAQSNSNDLDRKADENIDANFELFKTEFKKMIERLAEQKAPIIFTVNGSRGENVVSGIEVKDMRFDSNNESLQKLKSDIVACIQDDEVVYADTTFGEKPDTIAMHQALTEIYTDRILQDPIALCVYGQAVHENDLILQAAIKDITTFILRSGFRNMSGRTSEKRQSFEAEDTPMTFKKRYITFLSQAEDFKQYCFHAQSGDEWEYRGKRNRGVYYPIIPVIEKTVEDGDEIIITAVKFVDEDGSDIQGGTIETIMESNAVCLKDDMDDLQECLAKVGQNFKFIIDPLKTTFNASWSSLEQLCNDLIDRIKPGEIIYADTTFGEKPDTVALHQALVETAINRASFVRIADCVYGYIDRSHGDNPRNKLKSIKEFIYQGADEMLFRQRGMKGMEADAIKDILRAFWSEGGDAE